MTIPYNATARAMKDYLAETLERVESDTNGNDSTRVCENKPEKTI